MQQEPVRIWIDVEDLFVYARTATRPSGIQRVVLEICHALRNDAHIWPAIRFVRHTPTGTDFVPVAWAEVEAISARLAGGAAAQVTGQMVTAGTAQNAEHVSRLRRMAQHIPTSLRVPAGQMVRSLLAAGQALSALGQASGTFIKDVAQAEWRNRQGKGNSAQENGAFTPRAGDVVLTLGASWTHAAYGALLQRSKERYGVRAAVLVHDLVPLLWPEWCRPGLPSVFRRWYAAVLPECDVIFANSEATRQDVLAYAAQHAQTVRAPVITLPMGSGFVTNTARPTAEEARLVAGLGAYVLCVGTLEARKNHAVLFRTWRRLLQERPTEEVPKLVLAGCQGWLVDDLMQQIRNSAWLEGHVVWVDAPSDALMAHLYQNCLFTVFPSFYEGWGLPVTESLAWGKACLISDRSSLPEAGGGLAEAFDPDNGTDLLARIRRWLDDPQALAAQEDAIRAGFRPVAWGNAVDVLKQALLTEKTPEKPETGLQQSRH
ncbi:MULTISPECIES: glycosyltransferase family 4 protein [Acetobacter]|uniref:Glycosyltransferase family 1 protein n=1 Tax=Acetobacter tropicalis TaxID=104102 RepID=A0A291PHT6_9PROT|nr:MULTISPECIES: glycosyltransferase family 1 protein [Acetobacter]ATJ91029.1 glycosyltransferase family 1 protein [Acetobacter tropicalis]